MKKSFQFFSQREALTGRNSSAQGAALGQKQNGISPERAKPTSVALSGLNDCRSITTRGRAPGFRIARLQRFGAGTFTWLHRATITRYIFTFLLAALTTATAFAKLNVVATTPDFGALAQQIGGDKVDVFTIARPTEDPHFVDAKPSFVVKLNRADALIEGGAELESGWLRALLDKARNSKLEHDKPGRIVAHEGVQLLEVPATLDRAKGDVHAAGNPHFTTDPLNAKIVAGHIANAFSHLDPKSASVFQANLDKFNREIDAKIPEWMKRLAPLKGKRVVAYHNAWPYFAKRFDVRIDLFLEPKPGIPPSPSHLAGVVSTMKSEGVKIILVEPFRDRRYAETLASHAEAVVLDVAFVPGAKGAGDTYIDWMDKIVSSLVNAAEGKK